MSRAPLGSLAWAKQTRGQLSLVEKLRCVGPVVRTAASFLSWRLYLACGGRASRQGRVDVGSLVWPDTPLAKAAEEACFGELSIALANHSVRSCVFALALADFDGLVPGRDFDLEHLYVTSLLHDISLETPEKGCCFAVRGGWEMEALAVEYGCTTEVAEALAAAIVQHITPGLTFQQDGLAYLIQAGAMVDLTGLRLWHVDKETIDAALVHAPRAGLKKHLPQKWQEETHANPSGRASLIEWTSLFTKFVRWSPFKE